MADKKSIRLRVFFAGVGGQGSLTASRLLGEIAMEAGYDTLVGEIHGMSQRGGSVTSYVRWGEQVFSPIIGKGEVDFLVAFEKLEALRYLDHLRPNGIVLVNDQAIEPITVKAGDVKYPDDASIRGILAGSAAQAYWVNGHAIAEKVGNSRTANLAILGALSALLDTPLDEWLEVVSAHVPPKAVEVNRQAFMLGRETGGVSAGAARFLAPAPGCVP